MTTVSVIGQKKILSPREERREAREKRRAERIASFERYIDSLVESHNFEFNPQTMQRQPAGILRQIMNPAFNVSDYTTQRTHEGWRVTFSSSLFSAANYTFSFKIYSRTDGANLTISNPWYSPVEDFGSIAEIY